MEIMAYTTSLVACAVMLYAFGVELVHDYLVTEEFNIYWRQCLEYEPLLPADDTTKPTILFLDPPLEDIEACALDALERMRGQRQDVQIDILTAYINGDYVPPVWVEVDVSDFDEPYLEGLQGSLFMSNSNYMEV